MSRREGNVDKKNCPLHTKCHGCGFLEEQHICMLRGVSPHFLCACASQTLAEDDAGLPAPNPPNNGGLPCTNDSHGRQRTACTASATGGQRNNSPQGRCLTTLPTPLHVGTHTETRRHDTGLPLTDCAATSARYLLPTTESGYRHNTRPNDSSPLFSIFSGYLCVSHTSLHNDKFMPEQLLTFRFAQACSSWRESSLLRSSVDCPHTPPRRLRQTPN